MAIQERIGDVDSILFEHYAAAGADVIASAEGLLREEFMKTPIPEKPIEGPVPTHIAAQRAQYHSLVEELARLDRAQGEREATLVAAGYTPNHPWKAPNHSTRFLLTQFQAAKGHRDALRNKIAAAERSDPALAGLQRERSG